VPITHEEPRAASAADAFRRERRIAQDQAISEAVEAAEVTLNEIARMLGVSRTTVWRARRRVALLESMSGRSPHESSGRAGGSGVDQ
jgi:transcriptional regulator of acetoin/glycerol metabolism